MRLPDELRDIGERLTRGARETLFTAADELDALNARVADLIDTNNRYLEEARQARRERDALLRGFKGIAAAIAVAVKDDAP